ncbi:MAG: isocitrate/isopropylmalate dehydrogenase family protein [Euryarchaeota archaeon]|nr:isocitrate/isopropylmalate dehydrogenase family protein [Euryarchaeota archaeon]MDE1835692.1 isocitrate/isopropylmalate dehydrogenase family protein [Euryarchaeota archaeon]MDE1880446.1 isocitrate/isopropylmalate dehydrogenase family protein [Euryarchaeota archaeon]MDE2043882.1 isocitrate/isopropylmalate dehydrogenase family protein [Thermoplasmata archaeon]
MTKGAYDVVLLPGDGTGPEVVHEGRKVLEALMENSSPRLHLTEVQGGAQYYQKHGSEWEPGGRERATKADAILLGAVGWPGVSLPDGNIAGHGLVLGMRFGLDLYANVRPCKLHAGVLHRIGKEFKQVWRPENVDMTIFRENTEGLYSPAHGELSRGGATEVVLDTRIITQKGSERIIRRAFEKARATPKGAPEDGVRRVTCIDKSNVLKGCQFFRATFDRIGREEFPEIERDYAYVDAFTQWLIRQPEHYHVAVATNMMGDIVTDLAAALQGGMGFAAGGNIGDEHAMFEPVHGSAPKYAGKNQVNPFATFEAVAMMLGWLGDRYHDPSLLELEGRLHAAIERVLAEGTAMTYDQGGNVTTSQAGDRVAEAVRSSKPAASPSAREVAA